MSVNDILSYGPHVFGTPGSRRFLSSVSATGINPGEPVIKSLGTEYVQAAATNFGAVGTDYLAGIAESTSTHTASVSGYVDVTPVGTGLWTIKPKVAATFGLSTTPVQATYNALVGYRVLIDLTSGAYTLLAVDASTYGVVVEYQDVKKANGRVLVSFRAGLNYLA